MPPKPPLNVRELIVQMVSTEPVHANDVRLKPEEIEELYQVDEASLGSMQELIAIVDDVLTTGAHFRAAKSILSNPFPKTPVVGLFIARRAHNTSDIEDIFNIEF